MTDVRETQMAITALDIRPLRASAVDHAEAARLKQRFSELKKIREPFYLTGLEFDQILKWKLRGQYGRQQASRSLNTEDVIRAVTNLALNITHNDQDYELELRMGLLTCLRGVGIPVGSAILALVFPEKYAVIDFRGWRQLIGDLKSSFSLSDYKRYMTEIRRLALELNWLPEEVDLAIWEYDRRNGPRRV